MHVSYAAQTCHSSDYVTPQCSFTEPVIHCTRKIDAILKVGSAGLSALSPRLHQWPLRYLIALRNSPVLVLSANEDDSHR